MLLNSIVLLTAVWLAMSKVLTCESLRNSGSHRGRHKYKRRQLYSGENNGNVRLHLDNSPLQHNPSLLLLEDDNEAATADATFELDKPLPIDQVAVPVGGKAYLPCDTRNEDLGKSRDSSGFYMVMWFKEQKENNPLDQSYEQAGQSSSSILPTSGEPIFTISQENISTNNTNISFLGADGAPPGSSHAMPNSLIKTIDGVESEIMTNNNNSEEIIAHNLSVSTNNTPETAICENLFGRRIVDIGYIFEQIKKIRHIGGTDCTFIDMKFMSEIRNGYASIFKFQCKICNIENLIYSENPKEIYIPINKSLVNGSIAVGIGYAQLAELSASIEVPSMCNKTYIKIQNYINLAVQKTAWSEMKQAGDEEREIALKNKELDVDGTPMCTVIADGQWSKRSYKSKYNALSGTATIIGKRTGKVLFVGVRNRYCAICQRASSHNEKASEHVCFLNWRKASTAMEADGIVEGFSRSVEMHGLKYNKLIGDGDSSVLKKLNEVLPYGSEFVIDKIECRNHLLRNFSQKINALANKTEFPINLRKFILSKIMRFRSDVTKAIQYRNNQDTPMSQRITDLQLDISNSIYHRLGQHTKCANYFCVGQKENETNLVPQAENCGLMREMDQIIFRLTKNANSLLLDVDNNPCEVFNSVINKYIGGKRINFSQKNSYNTRVEAAVIAFNSKQYLRKVHKTIQNSSPGKFGKKYLKNIERLRNNNTKRRQLFSKNTKYKIISRSQSTGADQYYGLAEELVDTMTKEDFDMKKMEFIKKLNEADRTNIEINTRNQSNNSLWFKERKKRLTASNFGIICKMRPYTSCKKKIHNLLYAPNPKSKQLNYGQVMEAKARTKFEEMFNLKVHTCGLIVDRDLPYLAASPDGLVGDNAIVEIKCPYMARQSESPGIAINNKLLQNWSMNNSGTIELKHNSNYYYQVIGQLHITQREICYVVVYTENWTSVEKIVYDHKFWMEEMSKKLSLYDTRQTSTKIPVPPRWWSSPLGFGDRAYFHTISNEQQLQREQDIVDHLTVDRAMATDTGVYRCRIDFLKAPTKNRLVNLTVIVAPERPTIHFEYGNSIGRDRPENYQQKSGNVIVVDEASPTVTLVCRVVGGWPRPRLTWYHENTVLQSAYQLVNDDDYSRGYRRKPNNSATSAGVTVNRLVLTNLTRWHPIMSQRQQTLGTARLTCQASNSILHPVSIGVSRPPANAVNLPPPATTEHTFIRLNLIPTEVQIISIKEYANHLKSNETHKNEKNEVFPSEDAVSPKKYTIRADRVYQAECRSKGSRPLATIEWYLLKNNQRFNISQSTNFTHTLDASSLMVLLGKQRSAMSANSKITISGIVKTQQTPEIVTDKDELVVTTSILSFVLWGPKSAVINENDDNESTLVCHAYNPVIKTVDRHYVETKITLDVQYPPIVELRFGKRMPDTGSIGPGDDVYFECAARANPSTTIRYSWYHNGVRLTQETEKRRTDDGDKRGEKRNNRLAGGVIQYSQLGSLVLQSVKAAAAGKYSCQATNGIDSDSNENKTISNTVRLYVKHVPVCQHREDIYIVTKKSDPATGPVIRCRAGHGHPPTNEYHWKFYPEQAELETHNRSPLESNEMTLTGRSIRELDSLLTETAVQGSDGGISYTFTTSTPVLKSYLSVVTAAASASSSAVRPNFLHGRLECRAVNAMGIQNKPCVYHITDKTMINQGSRDLQEITDCRSISKKELSNEESNTTLSYACGTKVKGIVTSTNRRTRFCITCSLNTSSLHYHQHRSNNYILQLFKSTPREPPATVAVAFNVTGVTITDNNNGNSRDSINEQDDGDYYFDPEEDVVDSNIGDYNLDTKNAVQKVVFVIDDSVEPGIYRGRIYNSYGRTISAIINGMINVAAVPFNDVNDNDNSNYIIDDIGDNSDESALGYAWRCVTVALVDAFSLVLPPSADGPEPDWDEDRARPPHKRWRATSAALTAVLVAVVAALSCGICGVVALLYRRQHYGDRRGDRGHVAYGLGCNGAGDDSGDGRDGTGKTPIVGRLKAAEATPPATDVDETRQQHHQQQQQQLQQQQQQQRQLQLRQQQIQQRQRQLQQQQRQRRLQQLPAATSADDGRGGACTPLLHSQTTARRVQLHASGGPDAAGRPLSAAFPAACGPDDIYDDDEYDAVASADAATADAATADRRDDGRGGPDIVMSTAAKLHMADTDMSSGNWPQKDQQPQTKFNTTNSNHKWSLNRLQYQKPYTTTIPRTKFTTTLTPTAAAILTNKHTISKIIKPTIDEPISVSSRVILNALHRESSI